MDQSFNEASRHLGTISQYKDQYDPSLLVRVDRKHNREQYGIFPNPLPFVGFDVWNAYEFSCLLMNRLPVSGVLKIIYDSNNAYIVESKSLKLYLNSFNMTPFNSVKEAVEKVESDLTTLLECEVVVHFFEQESMSSQYFYKSLARDLVKVVTEDTYLRLPSKDSTQLQFELFKEAPELLTSFRLEDIEDPDFLPTRVRLTTNLLRSNCKITNQPDWGDLFLYYKPKNGVYLDELSLLKYIVSFRGENHFHEEVCEMIYKRLLDLLDPEELLVFCQYTRRGGIDINPVRSTHQQLIPLSLIDSSIYHKTLRQ